MNTEITGCLVSFVLVTGCYAETPASGTGLARGVCAFLAIFWTMRLLAATFVFDVRPYPANPLWRAGCHATNVVFIYLPIVYAWAALKGAVL